MKKEDKIKETSKTDKKISKPDTKNNIYIGYTEKVVTVIVLASLSLLLGIYFIVKSIDVLSAINVNFREKSNVDYKVFLKNNEFYENKYLEKGMTYVASLIDKINAEFNYTFDIDKESNIEFEYDIIAELVISDLTKENIFLKKQYTILPNTKEEMTSNKIYSINKKIDIDYDYYNKIANNFRIKYGVETKSDLNIYLNIREKSKENNSFELNNKSVMSLSIPLSQKAINISLDYKDINKTSEVVKNSEIIVNNYIYIIIGSILILISLIELLYLIHFLFITNPRKKSYDKFIKKILNEYDRLIVETTTAPNNKGKNTIKVDNFSELLDVRDNLNLPIKYYIVNKSEKCQFYIDNKDELYILTIKKVDIEKQK